MRLLQAVLVVWMTGLALVGGTLLEPFEYGRISPRGPHRYQDLLPRAGPAPGRRPPSKDSRGSPGPLGKVNPSVRSGGKRKADSLESDPAKRPKPNNSPGPSESGRQPQLGGRTPPGSPAKSGSPGQAGRPTTPDTPRTEQWKAAEANAQLARKHSKTITAMEHPNVFADSQAAKEQLAGAYGAAAVAAQVAGKPDRVGRNEKKAEAAMLGSKVNAAYHNQQNVMAQNSHATLGSAEMQAHAQVKDLHEEWHHARKAGGKDSMSSGPSSRPPQWDSDRTSEDSVNNR